jgi:hypothetical protein
VGPTCFAPTVHIMTPSTAICFVTSTNEVYNANNGGRGSMLNRDYHAISSYSFFVQKTKANGIVRVSEESS